VRKLARQKLDLLNWAGTLRDVATPVGNRLKALKGDRLGQFSIRINRQYRICFEWTDRGPAAVEITDYH
jgi:proteic killer suppression protein